MSKVGRLFYLLILIAVLVLSACEKPSSNSETTSLDPQPGSQGQFEDNTSAEPEDEEVKEGSASAETVVKVNPEAKSVKAGETIQVAVDVMRVQNLAGVELHLTFDSGLLEAVDANETEDGVQIEHGGFVSPDFVALNQVDAAKGSVDYAVVQLPPTPAVEGEGTLVKLRFRGKGTGEATITLDQVLLATLDGEAIPASLQDSQITINAVN